MGASTWSKRQVYGRVTARTCIHPVSRRKIATEATAPECVAMHKYKAIGPGDPIPWFRANISGNPRFNFDTVGGRYVLLGFFGTLGDEAGHALGIEQTRAVTGEHAAGHEVEILDGGADDDLLQRGTLGKIIS